MSFIKGLAFLLISSSSGMIAAAETPLIQPAPWNAPEGSRLLWNGHDLAGWHPFVQPSSTNSLSQASNDGILHLLGKPKGYLQTDELFSNGHLHAEWRWPTAAKSGVNNSGIFLFLQPPDAIWPHAIQIQIKEGFSGDLIAMSDLTFPGRKETTIPKMLPSNEKPLGQWNSVDILFHTASGNTTLEVFINGLRQNSLEMPALEAGHIALQSEGSPVDFRNFWLEPLEPTQP